MEQLKGYNVAVVGATGAVGQQMIKTLESRDFPISTLTLLSSKRSAGTKVLYKEKEFVVQEATPDSFKGIDIALFSAGGGVSKDLAPSTVILEPRNIKSVTVSVVFPSICHQMVGPDAMILVF